MKIVIIGAGALGCLYGAALSEHNDVLMLDIDKKQVDAINGYGIKLVGSDGKIQTYKNVKAAMSGEVNEPAEMVFVMTKSAATEKALQTNRALFGEDTITVTLQNGAGNDRKIATVANAEKIVLGLDTHYCVSIGGGIVRHHGTGLTTIGSAVNNEDVINTVAGVLGESGFQVDVNREIQRIIWNKLFINVSINAFTAITNTPVSYMIHDQHAWNFTKRLVYEAVAVAEEDGVYFSRREVMQMLREYCENRGESYSSMYRDFQAGRKTDIDAINGEIVKLGHQYDISVPYNALIVDLIHAMEGANKFRHDVGLDL